MTSLYDDGSGNRHILPILLLALAVFLAGGGIWGYYSLREGRPILDPDTLCPTGKIHSRTVLLLDVSDPLTTHQRAALDNLLQDLRNPETSKANMESAGFPGGVRYIEPYGQLVAYLLDVEGSDLKPFLRVCNPGNPGEMTFEGELTASKRRTAARWEEFETRIKEKFQGAVASKGLANSPILEALALIVQREASSVALRASGKGIPLRIVIFSDMIQKSTTLSHFQEIPDWSSYGNSPQFAPLRSNLSNIDVITFYLRRQKYSRVQTAKHFNWWREAIARLQGRLIYLEPI